jgi:hypothetical protein
MAIILPFHLGIFREAIKYSGNQSFSLQEQDNLSPGYYSGEKLYWTKNPISGFMPRHCCWRNCSERRRGDRETEIKIRKGEKKVLLKGQSWLWEQLVIRLVLMIWTAMPCSTVYWFWLAEVFVSSMLKGKVSRDVLSSVFNKTTVNSKGWGRHHKSYSVIAIMLCYVFALYICGE